MRTSGGLDDWQKRFRTSRVDDPASRKAACRTKWGAYKYASKILKGPHPDVEKKLSTSAYYGPRYMYELAGKPIPAMESCFMSGYEFIAYMGTFGLKPTPRFAEARYNRQCWRIFCDYKDIVNMTEKGKPMSREQALKKSSWSLAYMMHHNAFGDKELFKRTEANYGYGWLARTIRTHKQEVRKALERNNAAAV
jgi:hypothetical protein